MSKLFVVFGATGLQGGAVIDYILNHEEFSKQFRLRGITRNATKPAAEALKNRGVEIVEADMNDSSSLQIALHEASAVFSMTNFWDTQTGTTETEQGKAEVETYIRGLPIPSKVFFLPAWFMQNIQHHWVPRPKKSADGTIRFPFAWPPEMRIPLIDITDTGKYIAPAIRDPVKYDGKRLVAATGYYTAAEIVDTWSRVSGKKARLIRLEEVTKFITHPIQKEVLSPGPLLSKYLYFGLDGPQEVEWTRAQLKTGEQITTWEEFLMQHKPLAVDE